MLAFMRHGETDWNRAMRFQGRTDIPLNATGRRQAREAGEAMVEQGEPWDLVVTSPLSRARETGEIVARALGAELGGAYDELTERSFGSMEGVPNAGLSPREYDALIGDAEPTQEVAARGVRAVAEISRDHPGRHVLMVSHGSLIRLTLSHWMRADHPRVANTQVLQLQDEWLRLQDRGGASG